MSKVEPTPERSRHKLVLYIEPRKSELEGLDPAVSGNHLETREFHKVSDLQTVTSTKLWALNFRKCMMERIMLPGVGKQW